MKRWANVIGLLLVLAFTVPASAQGPPLPDWARELMAECPGCQLHFTADGWRHVTASGVWTDYLDANAGMATAVQADPRSGWSASSPATGSGGWGTAFYDPLAPSEAVRGSVQAISQRSVTPYRPAPQPVQQYDPDKFQPPVWYNPFTGAVGYTMPSAWLFSLIAFNNYWQRVQRNLTGPVVN